MQKQVPICDNTCRVCRYFAELKTPFERSDGAMIYGYCFKSGDKDYSPNMGKGYPVFIDEGSCKDYKRKEMNHGEANTY